MPVAELEFFDANVSLGKHDNPYAASPFTADAAWQILEAEGGISEMLVYHSAAVLYDAHYGNQRLITETKNMRKLHRMWIALPEFATGDADTEAAKFVSAMTKNAVAAARICCRTHNFRVENHSLDPLLALFEAKSIPLFVDQKEISWTGLTYLLENFPGMPVILTNVGYRLGRHVEPLLKQYPALHLEIGRYQVHRGIEDLSRRFGTEQLIFGSGLPVFSPEPAMMMVASAAIRQADREKIAGLNLRRLLQHAGQ